MRYLQVACIVVVAIAIVGVSCTQTVDQERTTPTTTVQSWTSPRTPWGHPDLQGIWDSKTITPLQRPDRFGDRAYLTEQEVTELEKAAAARPGEAEREEAAAEALAQGVAPYMEDVVGSCLLPFNYSGTKVVATRRTSLIIDPPDGKIPYLERHQSRPPARASTNQARPLDNSGPADGPEDRPAIERCLGVSLPCLGGLCAFSQMIQNPRFVTIYYEQGHGGGAYRTIPLDARPHLPLQIRQWLGDSVGHWEDDTLVVDTTNFTSQTSFRGARENLHLIERFTRVTAEQMNYQVTVQDPTHFSTPWTLEISLRKASDQHNQIYETACHEGNYSLSFSLAGARASERRAATEPLDRR